MSQKRALAQEIRLGSPDRFSSWEGGVWGRDYPCTLTAQAPKFSGGQLQEVCMYLNGSTIPMSSHLNPKLAARGYQIERIVTSSVFLSKG